ncbi:MULTISPECIES: hypothetical protein [unclassified Paracoccus (in: a-proteobacteria)]|uniref:hypothetical protein n=1 Tax=unclassified Paracoccus (in: a-proteobacteria) TaxID=2688777 RepID=UPI0012B3D430|nr:MULTISPECIES: hypothetical protein [unclassified Paracoccus (in: a-proteobacteria)]UXU74518.1 hypothetical protein GB879_011530 [Paracoccus sp. SMMA_5]UXU80411.1 hypothetical protein GB880_011510 [Paracoccus sp. SMMA_5_TC]
MPQLVRLYAVSIVIGTALAAVFAVLIVSCDIAGLRHLILASPQGWIAGLMLWLFPALLFSGVQFGIRVMLMAEDEDTGGGQPRPAQPESLVIPVPVRR